MKKNKLMIILLILLFILLIIIFCLQKSGFLNRITNGLKNEDINNEVVLTYSFHNRIENDLYITITISSDKSINEIISPDGTKLAVLDNKEKVALDYKVIEGQEYTFKVKLSGDAEYKDYKLIPYDPWPEIGTANEEYINRFGKIVTGYTGKTKVNEQTWRLFYADDRFVYLIANSIGKQRLYYLPGFGTSEISYQGRRLFKKYTSWETQKYNNNIKATVALLDIDKWEDYKVEGLAQWAIGAPTIEMFVESYNATHRADKYSELGVKNLSVGCAVSSTASTGYYLYGGTGTAYGGAVVKGLGTSSSLDRAIYCGLNEAWFLAAPSQSSGSHIFVVGSTSDGDWSIYDRGYDEYRALRPLVRVPITLVGDKITITDDY